MTDFDGYMSLQPSRYLFRAAFLAELGSDQQPNSWQDVSSSMISSAHRFAVCLLGTIAVQPFIATQFSTGRRFVYFQVVCYFSLLMPHFQQGMILVSLFLGKPCVGFHKLSRTWLGQAFDLAVRESLILPKLTSLSASKVALEC